MSMPRREEVLATWGSVCVVCEDPIESNEPWCMGHLVDKKFEELNRLPRGSLDTIENIRPMHRECNQPPWKPFTSTTKKFWAWQKRAGPEIREYRRSGMLRYRNWKGSASCAPDNAEVLPLGQLRSNLPYGYAYDARRKSIRKVPEQVKVVKAIFRWAKEGVADYVIAARLNAEGIPTAKGKAWSYSQVNAIRKNRHYTGEVIYGIICPPLVSTGVYEQVRDLKALKCTTGGGPSCKSELELIPDTVCVECGGDVKDSRCLVCRKWQGRCPNCHQPFASSTRKDRSCSDACQKERKKAGKSPWIMKVIAR